MAEVAARATAERFRVMKPSATVENTERIRAARASGRRILGLSSGDPNIVTDPRIIAAAERAMRSDKTHYSAPAGEPSLRAAIVKREAERSGARYDSADVLVTPGGKFALLTGLMGIVNPGDEVLVQRDKTIDFSITYYTGGQSLLVPNTSTITGLKDLEGKQVSVQQGTTLEKNIAAAAPKAQVVAFKDYNSAWLALGQGRVDALTGSLNILQGFAKDNPNVKIVGELFSIEPFGIGIRQGDSALRDEINFTLQDLWTSGAYTELYRKWFHADPTVPIETWPN